MNNLTDGYECEYCGKQYKRESSYLNHSCEKMKRAKEIKTPEGIAAYNYYVKWLKLKHKRCNGTDTYLNSIYYKSFRSFIKFANEIKLPNKELFLKLMVDSNIDPKIWTKDETYKMYCQYIDNKISPIEHVKNSIRTLNKIANATDCEIYEVFDKLSINNIVNLIRVRRLSPWFLFHSKYLNKILNDPTITKEQTAHLDYLLSPREWGYKFMKHKSDTDLIKRIVKNLKM